MLQLNKNTENTIVFTASELCTSNYFVFELINQSSNQPYYFTAPNLSLSTRYNEFLIVETGSTYQNLTAGTISLQVGMYNYSIYSSDIQQIVLTGSVVERGILEVVGETANTYSQGFLNTSGNTKYFLGQI